MKRKNSILRITAIASVILGSLFSFAMLVSIHEQKLQLALLGFILGASIVWLVYLAIWFISRSSGRSMFHGISRLLVMKMKQKSLLSLAGYQEKMFIETIGAFLTISLLLVLAACAFFIVSGILYIAGRLSW